jgi:hypothetical protein
MGVAIMKDPSGIIIVRVSGIYTDGDRKKTEAAGRAFIDRSGGANVMVMVEEFSGWGKGGNWGNLAFMNEYDPLIDKIAIVSAEKWRDEMLMYAGAGLRKAAVSFFPAGEEMNARRWLAEHP